MSNSDSRIAVYTGSFDPITLGHLNVIHRSSRLVDKLIVGIGVNVEKQALFTPEERFEQAGQNGEGKTGTPIFGATKPFYRSLVVAVYGPEQQDGPR